MVSNRVPLILSDDVCIVLSCVRARQVHLGQLDFTCELTFACSTVVSSTRYSSQSVDATAFMYVQQETADHKLPDTLYKVFMARPDLNVNIQDRVGRVLCR
jgi:hypothetical protein